MNTFGTRDLALLLPDQVDTFSLRHSKDETIDLKELELKPKVDQSKKVTRYFPGQRPVWLDKEHEEKDKSISANPVSSIDPRLARLSKVSSAKSDQNVPRRRVFEATVIVDASNAESESQDNNDNEDDEDDDDDDLEGLIGSNKSTDKSKQFIIPLTSSISTDNDDDIALRRERILSKLSTRKDDDDDDDKIEVAGVDQQIDESESEYETASEEDEDDDGPVMLKPIFVPKHLRQTLKDAQDVEAEEELKIRKQIELNEERQRQTRTKLAETIRRTDEQSAADNTDADSDAGLPDDTDDPNDSVEYENWKIRELSRLKRDALQREKIELEKKELERRRAMTEEERLAEDKKLGIGAFKEKEKEKWKFMQRYYHKGVFYMDQDSVQDKEDVRARNYAEPTLEDKYNKEDLPSVLQVKKFGMRGRTKYTHLVDQDTTDFKNPLKYDKTVLDKYLSKRSGVGDIEIGREKKKAKQ